MFCWCVDVSKGQERRHLSFALNFKTTLLHPETEAMLIGRAGEKASSYYIVAGIKPVTMRWRQASVFLRDFCSLKLLGSLFSDGACVCGDPNDDDENDVDGLTCYLCHLLVPRSPPASRGALNQTWSYRSIQILMECLPVSALKRETLPFTIKAFSGTSVWSHTHRTRDWPMTAWLFFEVIYYM